MDVIVADMLSKWYICLYDQIGAQIHAPTPYQVFEIASQLVGILYDHSPPIVRTYCTILNSIPVQTEIIPVALAVLVLYALFATIVVTVKTILRLVYSFVRFSIIVGLATGLTYFALRYSTGCYPNHTGTGAIEEILSRHQNQTGV